MNEKTAWKSFNIVSGWENRLDKSLHFELLSLRVGRVCSDYLGHFAVEYIFSKKCFKKKETKVHHSQIIPDYILDMPVSFNMLSADTPWWESNLLILVQIMC